MRVVSMVPSWTETLVWAGVEVVGRTRFCIHPRERVEAIPIVGGTKDWKLETVEACRPDLLVLDKEENPRTMGEAGIEFWASRILGVESLPGSLEELAGVLANDRLLQLASRWRAVLREPLESREIPGVLEWGRKPAGAFSTVVYVIWKEPWMAVGPETFIGSVLRKLGLNVHPFEEAYPQFDPSTLPPDTLLLFSSEPYPFLRKREGLDDLGLPYALVDGEKFSWFGVRSLRFLESLFKSRLG